MAHRLNLNNMVYFEVVARHSHVGAAAQELRVSSSAVSQQIKMLEERLGVSLFRRVRRRLVLTEEGERLYVATNKALKMLRASVGQITRKSTHHSLIIRVASSFGMRWLGPELADFITAHPDIDLHVDATSELTDFEKENVDLEIRYGLEVPPGLHSMNLRVDRVLPMAVPGIGGVLPLDEAHLGRILARTRLIHTVKCEISWRHWLDFHGLEEVDASRGLKFDRSSMSLQAARDGLGVALESVTLAYRELRDGVLVPLAPQRGCLAFPAYWLTCPARHLNRRMVGNFVEWIGARAEAREAEARALLESLGVEGEAEFRADPRRG